MAQFNIPAEKSLLAVFIEEPKLIDKFSKLKSRWFYDELNRGVFDALQEMRFKGEPIDSTTLKSKIDPFLVDQIMLSDHVVSNSEYYYKTIEDLYLNREVTSMFDGYAKAFRDSSQTLNAKDVIDRALGRLMDISTHHISTDALVSISDAGKQAMADVRSVMDGKSDPFLADTELQSFNKVIPGFAGGDMVTVAGRPGHGKLLSLDTKILTIDGWKLNKDITMSDKIFGVDGKPHNIIGLYPNKNRKVYKVYFSNNTIIKCDAEHLWGVNIRRFRKQRNPDHNKITVMTTAELIDGGVLLPDGRKNYKMPVVQPIEFNKKDLPLHPYVVGCLIGDGALRSTKMFVNSEQDVVAAFNKFLGDNYSVARRKVPGHYGIIGIKKIIENMGLNTTATHKFIPHDYMFSDINDRLWLLRGLLDTYGFIHVHGSKNKKHRHSAIIYTTKSNLLAQDIKHLVESLGGRASIKKVYKKAQGLVYDKLYFNVNIVFNNGIVPISSKKHLSRYSSFDDNRGIYITKIEETDQYEDMQCLYVDAPENLFIIDGFIPTHNTSLALQWALHNAKQGRPFGIISMEMSAKDLYIRLAAFLSGISFKRIKSGELTKHEWKVLVGVWKTVDTLPLYIEARGEMNEIELKAVCRRMKDLYGVQAIAVDYIQLIDYHGRADSRQVEVSKVSKAIKSIAMELNIPIFNLAQLNRSIDVDYGKLKRPTLAHLRESGSIEQDSDIVIFVYDPVKQGVKEWEDAATTDGTKELIIAKYRNGETGIVRVAHIPKQMKVGDLHRGDIKAF